MKPIECLGKVFIYISDLCARNSCKLLLYPFSVGEEARVAAHHKDAIDANFALSQAAQVLVAHAVGRQAAADKGRQEEDLAQHDDPVSSKESV